MKKINYALIPFSLVFVGFILACNFLFPPEPPPTPDVPVASLSPTETRTPTSTSTPSPIPPTETSTPTQTSIPTQTSLYTPTSSSTPVPTSTPEKAPFCEDIEAASQSACRYPIAEQTGSFCMDKSPYNLIALSDSATFELLHENVECKEAGVQDGQRNIICTASLAYSYELRVCDSACSSLSVEQNLDKCSFGYEYNNLQNCCTNENQEVEQGCIVLKLWTKSCIVECDKYKNASTCEKHGYYCRWNYESESCQLRRVK